MSKTTTASGGDDDPEKSWDHGSVPAAAEGDPIDEGGIKRSGASDNASDEDSASSDGDQRNPDDKQSREDA